MRCSSDLAIASPGEKMHTYVILVGNHRVWVIHHPKIVAKNHRWTTKMTYLSISHHELQWPSCKRWSEWTSFLLVKIVSRGQFLTLL